MQWQQIERSEGRLHVHRVKNGTPSVHLIRGDEMRTLRKLLGDTQWNGLARRRAERLSPFFEFLDECSEMRGDGGREGVVLVLKAFPNC
jgi:hypothetical protein